jgi:hypothetical protein
MGKLSRIIYSIETTIAALVNFNTAQITPLRSLPPLCVLCVKKNHNDRNFPPTHRSPQLYRLTR